MSLKELFEVLIMKWKLILIGTLLFGIIGASLRFIKGDEYASRMLIKVPTLESVYGYKEELLANPYEVKAIVDMKFGDGKIDTETAAYVNLVRVIRTANEIVKIETRGKTLAPAQKLNSKIIKVLQEDFKDKVDRAKSRLVAAKNSFIQDLSSIDKNLSALKKLQNLSKNVSLILVTEIRKEQMEKQKNETSKRLLEIESKIQRSKNYNFQILSVDNRAELVGVSYMKSILLAFMAGFILFSFLVTVVRLK